MYCIPIQIKAAAATTLIEKKMHGLALTRQDIASFFWKLFECESVAFSSMAILLYQEFQSESYIAILLFHKILRKFFCDF